MNDPIARAKWVLESKGVVGISAMSLETIAKSEDIRYKISDYPDDVWDGVLIFNGTKRIILVNTHKSNVGKNNFTFAHELGHYFLDHKPNFNQGGLPIIRCTAADIEGGQSSETGANRFAVELLMPEKRFRLDMAGAPIDFDLIGSLSKQYMVSKHACSNRIIGLTQIPCVIIRSNGSNIVGYAASRAAKGFLKRIDTLPVSTAAFNAVSRKWGNEDFSPCACDKWLARAIPGGIVYECTHVHGESGTAMTILKW